MWEEVKYKCEQGRRTGTGITAEGDMLAALGYQYGTKKATTFAEKVQKELAINAYKSSCYMADERGAFPMYDAKMEKNNPFITRLREADPELDKLMKKNQKYKVLFESCHNNSGFPDVKGKGGQGMWKYHKHHVGPREKLSYYDLPLFYAIVDRLKRFKNVEAKLFAHEVNDGIRRTRPKFLEDWPGEIL